MSIPWTSAYRSACIPAEGQLNRTVRQLLPIIYHTRVENCGCHLVLQLMEQLDFLASAWLAPPWIYWRENWINGEFSDIGQPRHSRIHQPTIKFSVNGIPRRWSRTLTIILIIGEVIWEAQLHGISLDLNGTGIHMSTRQQRVCIKAGGDGVKETRWVALNTNRDTYYGRDACYVINQLVLACLCYSP